MKYKLLPLILFNFLVLSTQAQKPDKMSSAEIYESIKKLNFLGTVLYLGAHPDDENTQVISYFSNDVMANTAYLSMTRGDGGQNLIGPELRELLGVIRTEELLAARNQDGGKQFFTSANDFGYSKHPEETFRLWDRDSILKDVVTVIRNFKPDIIINRFDHRTPGSTHGHHTASAMLSVEAFEKAGDDSYKSFSHVVKWQPKRLFFNTSWWFYGSREKFDKADKSKMISLDLGKYYPGLGLSNNEISALSRSQHKSQGFGSSGRRGTEMEYLELVKGTMPSDKDNIFEGIDTSWNRIEGGKAIGTILSKVQNEFNFKDPAASILELVKAYDLIEKLQDTYWRTVKLDQIKQIIAACAGLYMEAVAEGPLATFNTEHTINLEAINRSTIEMALQSVELTGNGTAKFDTPLKDNFSFNEKVSVHIPETTSLTAPYWLIKKGTIGRYRVPDKDLTGSPETPRSLKAIFNVTIFGTTIPYEKDVVYKYNDPVKGEVYEPFDIVPELTTSIADKVIIFADKNPRQIPVTITAYKDSISGTAELCVPEGWKVFPEKEKFSIASKNTKKTIVFTITPPDNQSDGIISPILHADGKYLTQTMVTVSYDHIPKQNILLPSESRVVRLDIKTRGSRIAYILGAGDEVPASLRQIGFSVEELNEDAITAENLKPFDAVILGIRTYNVSEKARFWQKALHEYIKNGGTVIVQYNTDRGLKVDAVAPFSLNLSRDRVVEEDAQVTILEPENELMNFPNKITNADFDGWVQERGLYFPDSWDRAFTPVLAMHDSGEKPLEGSLLTAKYGEGYFVYTGLSFFRELPVGVPGAYKLFANMIAIGKDKP